MATGLRIARIDLLRTMRPISALVESASGQELRGNVLDVSGTGLFVASDLVPGQSAAVVVRFQHPNGTPIEVRGQVRWSGFSERHSTTGFGVQVEAATDSYFDLYQKLLDELGVSGLDAETP
jgi:hypothetical protein